MKRIPVYIIHPFKGPDGDYENNLKKINQIATEITEQLHPWYIPISPVHTFSFVDESKDPTVREKALENCLEVLEMVIGSGGQAWVFGDYAHSHGCLGEIIRTVELEGRTIFHPDIKLLRHELMKQEAERA